jgi:hypothetical protein
MNSCVRLRALAATALCSCVSRRAGSSLLIARGRAIGLLAVASVAGFLWPASAGASTTTFPCCGEQTYTVPAGVHSLSITAIGAHGGGPQTGMPGGRGALVSGIVNVTPGQNVYVEVGGSAGSQFGGFNGGGSGGGGFTGWGGGGASDVRTLPMFTGPISLLSRLIVAAGGGGSGDPAAAGGDAGAPGGAAGPASIGGGSGTQTAGGAGGCAAPMTGCGRAGSLGTGGDGGYESSGFPPQLIAFGPGGGGGLYGGGGGGHCARSRLAARPVAARSVAAVAAPPWCPQSWARSNLPA